MKTPGHFPPPAWFRRHDADRKPQRRVSETVLAFTLLELLVVIAILAALTTLATRSLFTVDEQTQFDANEALARDFRRALVGLPGAIQTDGTPSVSGIIADLGRPPRAELEDYLVGENEVQAAPTGKAYTLRELVEQRNSPPFSFYQALPLNLTWATANFGGGFTHLPLDDATLQIPTGWKGPYLQGGTDSVIRDAWTKPIAAYSVASRRRLIDFWTTSYGGTTAPSVLSTLNPFTFSLAGYHPCGSGSGAFMKEVIGIIITPGSALAAAHSLSLPAYSNVFNAGVVFTNDFVSQLACTLRFNTNALPNSISTNNYHLLAGIILYGPNPHFNATAGTSSALSRPVGVAWIGTANTIDSTHGAMGGASELYPNALFPNSPTLVFADYPIRDAADRLFPIYPLVHGTKVVKPFLLAQPKVGSPYEPICFWGPARNLILRPGFNGIQLTIP